MKKLLPIVWASIALTGLHGCSGQSLIPGSQLFSQSEKIVPLKPLKAISPSIKTNVLWQVQTGCASKNSKIHPYINSDHIIVAGGNKITAWDKKTGKSLWKNNLEELISGGVNGGDGIIYFGTDRGNAIALDESTGKTLWIKPIGSEILSVSKAKNDRVFFRTINGKLLGLSSKTGDIKWQHQQLTPVLSTYGASVPVLAGPYVIAGFDNGKLIAYEQQNGSLAWEATLTVARGDNELDRMVDIDGKLKTIGSAMFASSFHGGISGVDLRTGKIHWAKKIPSYTGTDADIQGVYTSDDAGNVWRLNPQTGDPLWKMDDLMRRSPTAPTLVNTDTIIVGDKQGNLHFINTQSGLFVARIKGDQSGYNVPSKVDGKTIYSFGRGGLLTAIKIN